MLGRPRFALTLGLVVALPAVAEGGPRVEYVGSYAWPTDRSWFGGFSAIDTDAAGTSFLVVSDLGYILPGRFIRDDAGRVTAIEAPYEDAAPLGPVDGKKPKRKRFDSEGLALLPDGGFVISFERPDQIALYRSQDSEGTSLSDELDLSALPVNKGFEAVAVRADGALYAILEIAPSWGGPFPVHVRRGGAWSVPFSIPATGTWRPVGADFGPDGRLYVLERDFWGLVGFMSRVRRITLDGETIVADDTLIETRAGVHENLEGIAVWQDGEGRIRLTMISDDNVAPLQKTEIVDYLVAE